MSPSALAAYAARMKKAGIEFDDPGAVIEAGLKEFGDRVPTLSVAFSSAGQTGAFGGYGAHFWNTTDGSLPVAGQTEGAVTAVALTPDGRLITGERDLLRVWDAHRHESVRVSWPDFVNAIAVQPEGKLCAMASLSAVEIGVIDLATGKQLMLLTPLSSSVEIGVEAASPEGVSRLAFSADGQKLYAAYSRGSIRIWDVGSGKILAHLDSNDLINFIAFERNKAIRIVSPDRAELWDLESGKLLKTANVRLSAGDSAALSQDARLVFAGSRDGTVRIVNLESGQLLATIALFKNGSWAIVAPDGRFDTDNLDGGSALQWMVSDDPLHALPLEVFMRDYCTPRLLSRILNGEQFPPIRSIAEIKNRVQPVVKVVAVAPSKKWRGRVDVVVRAASGREDRYDAAGAVLKNAEGKPLTQASGLRDLRLFRNGRLVGWRPGDLEEGDFTFEGVQMPARDTETTFTAYAFSSEDIKSSTAELRCKTAAPAPASPRKPQAWLVQIGVNHYAASACELHGAVRDAEALSAELAARVAAHGYQPYVIKLLSTAEFEGASKKLIRQALAEAAAQAGPDDVFFLSFSGHGYSDAKGQFYIFPGDVEGSCQGVNDTMLAESISADELTEWLRPIDAGEMTFILDSCDSASSVESNGFKPGPMGSRGLGQLAYDKRMRILAASQPNQFARESSELGQGLLTWALTEEGLKEGKADWKPVDKRITVGEWLNYAAQAVPKYIEAEGVKGPRAVLLNDAAVGHAPSLQTPAVFDFSKHDDFELQ